MTIARESFGPLYKALTFPWYGGALGRDCLFRFVQMFLEIGHEGCTARSDSGGVALVGLMLAVNVAVGIADVDLAKLG